MTDPARILVVEDEPALAGGLVDVLRVKGYRVDHCSSGEEALEALRQHEFHLLLLDAGLPGISGFEVLRETRGRGLTLPILMLTARGSELDRVLGFELGVDDYVTKPFSLLELLGRISALLRRARPLVATAPRSGIALGQAQVDFERFRVYGPEGERSLPSRGFDLLRCLHQRQGQVVTRDTLIDEVWGQEETITLRTLNNLIVKVRQVIEDNPEEPRHLKTVHGVGYRLDV